MDIDLSSYPDEIDNIEYMREPTDEELTYINNGQYSSLSDDAKQNVFVTALKINKIIAGLASLQNYFKTKIENGWFSNGGTYSSSTTYQNGQKVRYNDTDWLCIQNDTTGVTPSDEATDNWAKMTGQAVVYYLDTDGVGYIQRKTDSTLSQSTITVTGYIREGSNDAEILTCSKRFYYQRGASTWYLSAYVGGNETANFTIPSTATALKIEMIYDRVVVDTKEIAVIDLAAMKDELTKDDLTVEPSWNDYVPEYFFAYRNDLAKVIVSGNKDIEYCAFEGSSITELEANSFGISNSAFRNCTNLTTVTLSSDVETIGTNAFYGCTNLTTITINKEKNSISGSPWGATYATVNWVG